MNPGRSLFAKLVVLVVGAGLAASALLAMRHSRMEAAHELAESRLRIRHVEHELQILRAQIATRTTPTQIQRLAAQIGPMHPIGVDPDMLAVMAGAEPAATLTSHRAADDVRLAR